MRKSRESKSKAEVETVERARDWSESKCKDMEEIYRLSNETRENAKFEVMSKKNANVVNRAAVKASDIVGFSVMIQGENRERAEADARAKDEAEIWEKSGNMSESKEEAEAETVEIARAWAKAKSK